VPQAERDRAVRHLAAQHAVMRVLAEAETLAEATPRVLEAIAETLGWSLGAIWLKDANSGVLYWVEDWVQPSLEVAEFEELSEKVSFAPGVGLPGRVLESARPAWIADVSADDNFPRARVAAEAGLRAAFAFPIHGGHEILGVIEFFAPDVRDPDQDVLDLVEAFGRQIGQYVERKRGETAVRRSEALKTAILDSALDCVITMDHEGRVVEFNPAAERTFGYTQEDAIGEEMASLIVPHQFRDAHRRALARYVETEEPTILDSRLELIGLRADGSEFPVELTVTRIRDTDPPMFTGYIRDIADRQRAEDERLALLESEHAARLAAEEAERRSSAIAQTLQQSLLPPHLPEIAGVETASFFCAAGAGNQVGGDFYDLFYTGQAGWVAVIGDVCGKGPEAAALTALMRYTLRAAAMREGSPRLVLERLNQAVLQQRPAPDFCTVAYAALEVHVGRVIVNLACGGHPLPLVLRTDGTVEPVGAHGTLIGVSADLNIGDESAELGPGDALVLYTDGLTELRTPEGLLGPGGLAATLGECRGRTAQGIVDHLEECVINASSNVARDDIAIVVLRAVAE